jgi:hypothetical protein
LKDTFYHLYLAKTNGIPKDENGEDFAVVYCLEKGKELSPELEKNPDLRYFLIVLQKTSADLNSGMLNVKLEWNIFSELTLELEHITDSVNEMTKEFRELLNECEEETVIFKSQIVGFDKTMSTELKEARKLILGVATKSKWNFWS